MTQIDDTYDNVPDEILLPTGTYDFQIVGFKSDVSAKGSKFWNFRLRPIQVVEASITDEDLGNAKTVFHKLYDTPNTARMGKQFFEEIIGIDTAGVPKPQLVEAAVGSTVRAYVVQKPPQKEGGNPFVEVERFLRREAA